MDPVLSLSAPRPAVSARMHIADASLFRARSVQGSRNTRLVVYAKQPLQKGAKAKPGKKGTVELKLPGKTVPKQQKVGGGTVQLGLPGLFGNGSALAQKAPARRPPGRRDAKTVFVAGASGRLGFKILIELVAAGFRVIAGARNTEKAEALLEEAVEAQKLSKVQAKGIRIVSLNVSDGDSIRDALGSAGKVVCAIGASDADLLNISGPKEIDGLGTIRLVDISVEYGVTQFVLISSLGTGKFGLPAGALNLFWGVLSWKKKAEEALEKSGMDYTIIRPGGMERPQDDYKETYNMRISDRDTLFTGQVSRLQIAELTVACCKSPDISSGKCLEVVAETTAPLVDYPELLSGATVEVTQEEIQEMKAAAAQKEKDRAAAEKLVTSLMKSLQDIKERKGALQDRVKELQNVSKAVATENSATVRAASKANAEIAKLEAVVENKAREEAAAKAVLVAAQKAAREGRILSPQERKDVTFPILQPEAAEAARQRAEAKAAEEAKAEAAKAAKAAAAAVPAKPAPAPSAVKKAPAPLPFLARAPAKKPPVRATARMADPPVKVKPSPTKAQPAAPLESSASVEARVLAQAKEAAEAKAAKAAKARASSAQKALEAEQKAREEAQKAYQAAQAALQKQQEEAVAKWEAELKARAEAEAARKAEEAEKLAAAEAAKAAEKEAAAKAAAEKEAAAKAAPEEKEAAAEKVAAAKKTAPKAAAATSGNSGGGGFKLFGFKAPWSKPSAAELEIAARKAEAKEWIENWRNRSTDAREEEAEDVEQSASKWIQKWRAKDPEKKLPVESSVKQ